MSLQTSASDQEAGCQEMASSTNNTMSAFSQANARIKEYLMDSVPVFAELTRLRKEGWQNPEGDAFFKKQRNQADEADEQGRRYLYKLMKRIGQEIHGATKCFRVDNTSPSPPHILDMCMAPGGFLETALRYNPGAHAVAFTLPEESGGHKVLLPWTSNLTINFLDVNLLAEDMGVTKADISPEHPDATNFLQRQLPPELSFHLVLCDGQVLRTHKPYRASYREDREALRLRSTQLALGLEHLQPGGTMIVLLHRADWWDTICLLYIFSKFSDMRLFKPRSGHRKRSSFYMIAQNVQSRSQEAIAAVQQWKEEWKTATFLGDEEYNKGVSGTASVNGLGVDQLLAEFGPDLAKLGESTWRIQADALAKAPFIKQ